MSAVKPPPIFGETVVKVSSWSATKGSVVLSKGEFVRWYPTSPAHVHELLVSKAPFSLGATGKPVPFRTASFAPRPQSKPRVGSLEMAGWTIRLGTLDRPVFDMAGKARERVVSSKIMETVSRSPTFLLLGDRFKAFRGPLTAPI